VVDRCVCVSVCVCTCVCVHSLRLHTCGALCVNHGALVCRIQSPNWQLLVAHVGRSIDIRSIGGAACEKLKSLNYQEKK
jgi:hypothetical protein